MRPTIYLGGAASNSYRKTHTTPTKSNLKVSKIAKGIIYRRSIPHRGFRVESITFLKRDISQVCRFFRPERGVAEQPVMAKKKKETIYV